MPSAIDAYFGIFRNSPFGIYLVDADFCLVDVSKGCRNVFAGIEPLLGRDFAEVLQLIWKEPFAPSANEFTRMEMLRSAPRCAHERSYDATKDAGSGELRERSVFGGAPRSAHSGDWRIRCFASRRRGQCLRE
jgi:hypothetical protein